MNSVDDLLLLLEQLNDIGSSLSKERDMTLLLERGVGGGQDDNPG